MSQTAALPLNALNDATPNQHDLLDLLNNRAALHPAQARLAADLLKWWYPMSYNLWLEHQEAAAWRKGNGIEAANY